MGSEESLAFTPSWAVAAVTALLVTLSLLFESSLHNLSHVVLPVLPPLPLLPPDRQHDIRLIFNHISLINLQFVNTRKRKALNQTVDQLKSGLRNMGFITLLLSVAKQPVSKICIQRTLASSFLPCSDETPFNSSEGLEVKNTCTEGYVSFLSPNGTHQLQMLIMMLAVFHLTCSLVTLGLREIKMKKWELWEQETKTLDHKLFFDKRRFMLTKETVFGRRHLNFWSNNDILLWIVSLHSETVHEFSIKS